MFDDLTMCIIIIIINKSVGTNGSLLALDTSIKIKVKTGEYIPAIGQLQMFITGELPM